MLARKNRLTAKADFEKVRKEGRLYQFDDFGLVLLKKGQEEDRFGFVVSKKIAKDAVDRNRIKRALGEAVRQNIFYLKKGYDIVFLTKPSISGRSTVVIMKQVKEALKSIKLLK